MTGPNGDPAPDFALLVDLVEGRLDATTATRVGNAASRGDPETTASLHWITTFVDDARAMPLHPPPPVVRQSLQGHFARWSRARATLDRAQVELVASLLFDSRLDLAAVGVRGADDTEGTVHLAYTTGQADLVLDVRRSGGGLVRLDGQVLLTDVRQAPIFEAMAVGPRGSVRTVDGDELGNFSLAGVPTDTTEVRVTNGDLVIVAAVDLQDEDAGR